MRYAKTHLTNYETRDDGNVKTIAGYFSVFDDTYDITDRVSESISRDAFNETINDDIRALTNHDTTLVLGRTSSNTLKLSIDDKGLYGEILINEDDQDALNLYARVQRGDVSHCSFGFEIIEETYEETERADGWHRHYTIDKVKLFEVSCVTFPRYESTTIQARQKDDKEMLEKAHTVWKERAKKKLNGGAENA